MPIGQYDPNRARHRSRGPKFDAEGWTLCVHCGERIAKGGRLRWHSECVQDHAIRMGGSALRAATKERDKEVCAMCGTDCRDIRARFRQAEAEIKATTGLTFDQRGEMRQRAALAITQNRHLVRALMLRYHLWEADHIVPKSEGGRYTGLDNIRTLCKSCHAAETGRLRKRLNAKAKEGS